MNNVEILYKQSSLSLAAYSVLTESMDEQAYITALQQQGRGMSESQAKRFAAEWSVVEQYNGAFGLSATVFRNNADNTLHLAIRGTQDSKDLLTDGLLALGVSIALNAQWLSLKDKLTNDWMAEGGILEGGATVSGHSLGGYLAAAVKEEFGSTIGEVYLYNAPGSGGLIGNIASLVSGLFSQTSPGTNNIWNIKASEGLSLIAGLGGQPAGSLPIPIEESGFDNHSIVVLTDALAVQTVYAQLAPSLAHEQLNALIDASGGSMESTLEGALDALRKIAAGGDIEETPVGPRDTFYANLYALQADITALGWSSTTQLSLLTSANAVDIQNAARQDTPQGLAARYALYALNPFVLTGADYSGFDANGELALFDSASGDGMMTDRYLEDRANFLVRKLWFSTEDKAAANPDITDSPDNHPFQNEDSYYEDVASGYRILQGGLYDNTHVYAFGDDKANILLGKEVEDHLYGGAGNDVLIGAGGNDYLQGDIGNDILIGGKDDDQLNGGKGFDSYVWKTGDGHDKIIDIDRKGRILTNGQGVGVLIQQSATSWASVDGKVTLTQGANWMLSIEGGGSLNLGNAFNDGDYGIHRLALPTLSGLTLTGDYGPLDGDTSTPSVDIRYDSLGNLLTDSSKPDPGREDTLYGGAGNDLLQGMAGQDILTGNGGDDQLEGGADSDIVMGGAGNDVLYAEASVSLLEALSGGAAGQDVRGDWLDGGEGNDILVGGVAKDLLTGGNGADLLIGGAGNDVLYGDAMQIGPAYLDWSVGRQVIPGDGITTYRVVTTQAWLYEDSAQGSDDTLHGGAGDDWLFGGAGNDLLDGGENTDVLLGEAGNDTLIGGMGNDVLNGDNAYLPEALHGDDWLDGGEGDDKLFGGAGDDVLIGGKDNDILVGGKGKDTYIFNAGDGKDDIYDTDTGPEASVIVFGEGVNRNNIKLHKGSMIVDFGDGDSLHFTAFDDMDPLGTPLVSAFQFSDGYSMSWDELLSRGFDIDGTNGDDVLIGTGVEDRIDGKDGDDSIQGLGGDDTITGGPGTDAMDGGAGNDTYVLNLGDSPANQGGAFEAIYDESGDDAIRLGDGIVISNLITETTNEEDLLIRYGGGQVVIVGGQRGVIENIQFADGSKFSIHSFVGQTLHAAQDVSIFERGVMLMGGTEADILTSYGGDNTISGGHGDDHLFGFDGGNTYLYELGDGVDTITDNSAKIDHFGNTLKNTLRFGKGIVPDDITLGYRGDQLILTIAGSEAICIKGFDAADALGKHAIDIFAFSDGTTLTYPELLVRGFEIHDADESSLINGTSLEDRIHGNSGDDALHGLSGNDHLWGGGEDDILYGGAGDDIYYFNLGDGSDTVIDTEGTNRVVFGAGLNFVDVRIEQAMGVDGESYLDLTFASGDRFSIRMGERGYVQAFDFDGEVYGVNDLLAMLPSLKLIGDGTDEVLAGFEGDDTLWGGGGADTLNGNAGNDMLDGGARDDVLNGGIGVDTYIFNVGGGHDVVNEVAGEVSILGLGVGISPELLNYSRVGDDLVLILRADGGTIRISGYFNNPDDWTVRLNDDSIIPMATLLQLTQVQPSLLEAILSQYRSEARASLIAQWIREGYQVDANGVAHNRSSYANDYSAYGGNLQYVNREETYSAEFIAVDIQTPLNLPTSLNNFLYSSRAYSRGRASQHVASNYSSHNEFSTEWINQYVPARRAPADWHFISWNSSLSKSGGIQIPSTTYYFQRDPAGNIVGIWYWGSNGETPASVGLALVTVERVTETQSHHSYLPEFTLTDGDDVLSLFQSGIVYGGVGDDFIELGSDEYMEGIRLYYGMGGLAYGGEGDDTIVALDGDNVLIGGRGQDTLIGGHESDTFYLIDEDSVDYIADMGAYNLAEFARHHLWLRSLDEDAQGNNAPISLAFTGGNNYAAIEQYFGSRYLPADTLVLGPGITLQNFQAVLSVDRRELLITGPNGHGASVALATMNDNAGYGFEYLVFGDGTRLTMGQMMSLVNSRIDGSDSAEEINGDEFSNDIYGLDGDDVIHGGAGQDIICGGAGADVLDGGEGIDLLIGGDGDDTYIVDNVDDRVLDQASLLLKNNLGGSLGVSGFDVSSGGSFMAFISSDRSLLPEGGSNYAFMNASWGEAPKFQAGVFIRDLQTGLIEKVVGLTDFGGGDEVTLYYSNMVSISTDNRHVAFLAGRSFGGLYSDVIYVKDLDSGALTLASSTQHGNVLSANTFNGLSGDGRYALFSHQGGVWPNHVLTLYVKDIVTGMLTQVADNVTEPNRATISDDGRYVFFNKSDAGLSNVYVSDLQAHTVVNLTADMGTGSSFTLLDATPDASRIAAYGSDGKIYLLDRQKQELQIVPLDEYGVELWRPSLNARLSNDGRYLAFNNGYYDNEAGYSDSQPVYVFDVVSGELRIIGWGEFGYGGNGSLSFSDDGRDIYFQTAGDSLLNSASGVVVAKNPLLAENGNDSVRASVSYTLLDEQIENLVMTGTNAIDGTGNARNNVITGNVGDNVLVGGRGNDFLDGGDGDDAYVFYSGDGIDHILDSGGSDAIIFNGVNIGDISLGLGSLRIRYGADEVHIEAFDPEYAENSGAIEQFFFDDGMLGYHELLALGFDIEGDGNITGTSVADRISGGDGDDTIRGGRGADVLTGGAGNDTYILNVGDGNDTIVDAVLSGSANQIRFGEGIDKDALIFNEQVDGVMIRYSETDAVFLPGAGRVADVLSRIEFSDGSGLSFALAGNLAPLPSVPLTAQVAEQGPLFSFSIPQDAFFDPEGEPLSLSLSLVDGRALPTWLSYDPLTRTLSGRPGKGDVGTLQLILTATDPVGATATQILGLNVLDGNSAPTLIQPIPTQWATEDFAFSYTLPVGTFADLDEDALGYQVTLVNGNPLPSWLSFNSVTRTLTGIPPDTAAGILSLLVSASDPDGLSATAAFTLDIANHLVGNGNENTLTGTALRDYIEGRGDDDELYGGAGDDYLDGGRGEDTLYGGAGNDTLYGGISDNDDEDEDEDEDEGDLLIGGTGDDTYIIDRTSTRIHEYAGEGTDTVKSSITYTLVSNLENLTLTGSANINGTGNSLANVLTGNSGNNTLNGGGGNDTLDGGSGSDVLLGGSGSDTYLLGRGYGSDTIQENDATIGNIDVVRFLEGIAIDQLWFRHVGNNLEVSIIGTGDRFTIHNWYSGNAYPVEQFRTTDGQTLLDSRVENLVQAMAAFAPPTAGQTSLPPTYQASLSPVLAANWQ